MTRLKLMLSGAVIAALGGLAGYGWAQTIAGWPSCSPHEAGNFVLPAYRCDPGETLAAP